MRTGTVLLLVLMWSGVLQAGPCAPQMMVKIIYLAGTDERPIDAAGPRPRTFYRLGSQYGRLEEAPDANAAAQHLHVTNMPDSWTVDLASKTGEYRLVSDSSTRFLAPVVGDIEAPDALRALEFGCELAYLTEHAAGPPEEVTIGGHRITNHHASIGEYRIDLAILEVTGKPFALGIYRGDELVRFVKYLDYRTDLDPAPEKFWPPVGVNYRAVR